MGGRDGRSGGHRLAGVLDLHLPEGIAVLPAPGDAASITMVVTTDPSVAC
jgi:hypothetical protein